MDKEKKKKLENEALDTLINISSKFDELDILLMRLDYDELCQGRKSLKEISQRYLAYKNSMKEALING